MRCTQTGDAKVNGRLSILEETCPSAATRRKLVTQCKQYNANKFGLQTLAKKLSALLHLDTPMSHEAARRASATLLHG